MIKSTRRTALALLGTTALAGCSATQQQKTAAWAADAQAIATGLSNLVPQAAAVAGVPAAIASNVSAALAAAASLAGQLAATADQAAGQSTLKQIEGYVNSVLSALQPYYALLPSPIGTVLAAATALLPFVEAALGMAVAAVSASPNRAPMYVRVAAPSTPAPGWTAQQVHDWAVAALTKT